MWICAEYRVEHIEPGGTTWPCECALADAPPLVLHRLIGRKVVTVQRDSDQSFSLHFSGGATLTIHAADGATESGHLGCEDGERMLVIF